MKTKILITVEGGLVQGIQANTADIEIYVADHDNISGDLFTYYKATPDAVMTDEKFDVEIKRLETEKTEEDA